MREKLKNMMWGEPTGEWIPYTFAEYAIMQNICENLPEIPVAEQVTFAGESNGRRNTEKQASLYDAMLAEIMGEHDGEKARVRNRRNERRNHMAESWEAEKEHRKDIHWSHLEKKARRDAGSKYGNHWSSNAERKICKAEQVARKDWEIEERNHADAMAEYRDYIAMAEDHERRLDRSEITLRRFGKMSKELIVAEIENLCRKFARTSDPVKKAELNAEIENLAWMLEEG